ncbi:MAG: hypothetical protein ABIO40_08310 [Devosia sp.]
MTGPIEFDIALSVGTKCRTAYQLRRVFGDAAPAGLFDWQKTPLPALAFAIRGNFTGMFERRDLVLSDHGTVRNRRLGTRHPHEFPNPADLAVLDGHYATARSRHDHLAARMRELFNGKRRLLLCFSKRLPTLYVAVIRLLIRRHYPALKFILLNGPRGDIVTQRDTDDGWQGTDSIWDAHLANYGAASGFATEDGDRPSIETAGAR